ncbi:MAG: GNAT family N-acetyltransferase [Hyphomonadaceae bacterium]
MIRYRDDVRLEPATFVELYRSCSLGARRPLDDPEIVTAMIAHGNLTITAWDGERVVGIARSMTDFLYVGYLADLAVRETHQRQGVGVELIRQTRARMGPRASLVLLAAPAAKTYYPRIGFNHMPDAWALSAQEAFAS